MAEPGLGEGASSAWRRLGSATRARAFGAAKRIGLSLDEPRWTRTTYLRGKDARSSVQVVSTTSILSSAMPGVIRRVGASDHICNRARETPNAQSFNS